MEIMTRISSANILLVEDERIVALDLATTLQELGYTLVASVSSGEAAIEQAQKTNPNLVLMDIRLAGKMDGIQAAHEIRKHCDIPIIYLTAHSDDPTLTRAKSTEPHGYLVKPFKAPELRCAIEIALHRQESEAKLREAQEKLRQAEKIESVARLSGGIAHEFNNLLSIVSGYAELLESDLSANEVERPRVEAIRKAVRRAAHLTRQLQAFGRGQILLSEVVDLNSVLSDMQRLLKPVLGPGIALTVAQPSQPISIYVDLAQFRQAVVALVSNSRDALAGNGKISMQVDEIVLGHEATSQYPDLAPGKYAAISIADTGPGMTPEVRARIFDPFFSTKESGQGMGLGLAAVHGFVAQSGGCISVESKLGSGTAFKILLPILNPRRQPAHSVPLHPAPQSLRGSENLLLVEDHPQLRDLFGEFLRALGYNVFTAGSGNDAVRVVQDSTRPLHLLVTDVLLPGMDGWQLAKRSKQLHPDLKVIYVSGNPESAFENIGEPYPDEVFLQKPVALEDLAKVIRQVLDRKPSSA